MPLTKKKKTLIIRWIGAILIALAVGTGIYLVATRTNRSAVDLYEHYYQPQLDLMVANKDSLAPALAMAQAAFQKKDYTETIRLLRSVLAEEPTNQSVQLALGICQTELGEIEKAKQTFSVIDATPYREKAQWYLAMIFLKQSDARNAQTILESIQPNEVHYDEAQSILKGL